MAQIIHGIILPFFYLFLILVVIYHVKTYELVFEKETNIIRNWLQIEVLWFFSYLWGCCVFLSLAYLMKTNSIMKSESDLLLDDDIWNDKDTDDFIRY